MATEAMDRAKALEASLWTTKQMGRWANMTEFEGQNYYPDTLWNRLLFRQGKRIPTDAELDARDKARADARRGSTRCDYETYRKRRNKSFFAQGLVLGTYLLIPFVNSHGFSADTYLRKRVLTFPTAVVAFSFVHDLVVYKTQRLHDVGLSGKYVLRPFFAMKHLKDPSGPPNEWGDGPN